MSYGEEFIESLQELNERQLNDNWFYLKENGYIWEDKMGNYYKSENLTDSHLLNILKFCERNYRPAEQVEELRKLAIERGLINEHL